MQKFSSSVIVTKKRTLVPASMSILSSYIEEVVNVIFIVTV